jgi:hypothetical protein
MTKRWWALAALLLPLAGWAQLACVDWKAIDFVDGKRRCMEDYVFTGNPPVGKREALPDLIAPNRNYVVVAPVGPSCPAVYAASLSSRFGRVALADADEMISTARQECSAALKGAAAGGGCECQIVVNQGLSPMTLPQFEALFARVDGATAAVPEPPPACDARERLSFAEGKSACLSEFTLNAVDAAGGSRPPAQLLQPGVPYALAATRNTDTCPMATGLVIDAGAPNPGFDPTDPRRRQSAALSACNAQMARLAPRTFCGCELVVSDGKALLPREEFERRYWSKEKKDAEATRIALAMHAEGARQNPGAESDPVKAVEQSIPPPSREELLAALQKRLAELEAARAAAPAAVAVAPPAPAPVNAPRLSARALVIGNSRYLSFGALANPSRDARAIAAKLRSFGIEVDLVLDAQRDDIIHALNEHSRKSAGKDVSILFYAGHGVQVEGINYLIPINMRADGLSAGYVKLAGISLNAALDYLPAKTRLVFLDACRDNPATRSLVATRGGATAGLAPVNAASGTLLSYATRDGATADDGDGQNSPYTTALLRHLDTPADISLVLRQVRQTVLQLTGGRQEPWEYGSLVGEQIVLPLLARK